MTEQRLTQAQLIQIVAEIEQLSLQQHEELDAVQVREILQELNLPPDLLEDALVQLKRREALAVQQQRRRLWMGAIVGVIAIALIGFSLFTQQQQQTLSQITAQQDRLTFVQDDGGNLNRVSRQSGNELFYRVTLTQAPVGQKLSLTCHWIDPNGQIAHQNRYQTQTIQTPVWNTFCRHTIGSAAPSGFWTVQLLLDDRLLSDARFEVQ